MRMFLKATFLIFLLGTAFSLPAYYLWYKPKHKVAEKKFLPGIKKSSEEFARLKAKSVSIKKYISGNRFNSRVCFLIDMKIPSGKERFFVYDLKRDSILLSGLVAHGSCDNGFQVEAGFSNKVNSGCSSTGNFRVGKGYNGRFGLAYKLYGLDSSNSNAYERTIVLHSYKCVPEQETYPVPICNSRGCPMVSPGFMKKIETYLNSANQPILLSIY